MISKNHGNWVLAIAVLSMGQAAQAQHRPFPISGPALPGHVRFTAWMAGSNGIPAAGQTVCVSGNPCFYSPAALQTAYAIPSIANANGGSGITVAIVDPYYDSQVQANLNAYISQYGLAACNNCLTIVSQLGGSPAGYSFNEQAAQEANLDVQMVYSIAPNAKILLVLAKSNSLSDLLTAVGYAERHADVVSNSYGLGVEASSETSFDTTFAASTVPILYSSGDTGSEVQYPCVSSYVTCVGGTNLLTSSAGYRTVESAWGDGTAGDGGSGGGCSQYVPSQSYQNGFTTCTTRGVPDVSAIGDPNTGFVVYLGTNAGGGANNAGLYVFGGTSVSTPMVAALVGLIDSARVFAGKSKLGAALNQTLYTAAAGSYYRYRFYDVTTGNTGYPAGPGWDKATGLGVIMGPSLANYIVSLP